MSQVVDNFLRYIAIDTQSKQDTDQVPSTEKQKNLASLLVRELKDMGAEHVRMDEHGYVYATIPATTDKPVKSMGFIAHMDTSPDFSGKDVKANIIQNYDGSDIMLNDELQITMLVSEFPDLNKYVGQDLITTDGTTLLGADDKAGVAEIMAMAQYLLTHPEIAHGVIHVGFTPDEEVGKGADLFDVEGFGAEIAYTVDGGELGEFEYENFNAASAKIAIHGRMIHPGSSKGKMKNALLLGMEFHRMLPEFENPMYTEGYEGFFHLCDMQGDVDEAHFSYIIRDHDIEKFQFKKKLIGKITDFMNEKYGEGTAEAVIKDSYFNMKEKIEPHSYLITMASEAMEEMGIEPQICPIRGGTDGARLSYMGLPCPNLCTGGHNFHGKYEFICIQSMEKVVELLVRIVEKFGKQD